MLSMSTKTKTTARKPGRPKSGIKTVRVSPRLPQQLAEKMRRAVALRGVKESVFIAEAIKRLSEEVIAEEEVWQLRREQAVTVEKLLAAPPKPTRFAREAAKLAEENVEIRS